MKNGYKCEMVEKKNTNVERITVIVFESCSNLKRDNGHKCNNSHICEKQKR